VGLGDPAGRPYKCGCQPSRSQKQENCARVILEEALLTQPQGGRFGCQQCGGWAVEPPAAQETNNLPPKPIFTSRASSLLSMPEARRNSNQVDFANQTTLLEERNRAQYIPHRGRCTPLQVRGGRLWADVCIKQPPDMCIPFGYDVVPEEQLRNNYFSNAGEMLFGFSF
jgi:hypothetical protein